jgi:ABC-type multidrug transport system ATPase subunit
LLPSADYLIRLLDGRIEAQGTPAELRAAGELEGLIALEEAEAAKEEAVTSNEDVEQEVQAVEGDVKKEKKKGPGKKLIQGKICDTRVSRE